MNMENFHLVMLIMFIIADGNRIDINPGQAILITYIDVVFTWNNEYDDSIFVQIQTLRTMGHGFRLPC